MYIKKRVVPEVNLGPVRWSEKNSNLFKSMLKSVSGRWYFTFILSFSLWIGETIPFHSVEYLDSLFTVRVRAFKPPSPVERLGEVQVHSYEK